MATYHHLNNPLLPHGSLDGSSCNSFPKPFDCHESLDDILVDKSAMSDHEEGDEKEKRMVKRVMGQPYAQNLSFWFVLLPSSIFLGFTIASIGLIFFGSSGFVEQKWVDGLLPGDREYGALYSQPMENGKVMVEKLESVGYGQGTFRWLLVTIPGSFLAGLVLLLPGSPPLTSFRTMFDELQDLNVHLKSSIGVILAAWVGLSTGATIGPETAVGTIGASLGSIVAGVTRRDLRSKLLLTFVGMTCSLGGFMFSPLIGILMTVELGLAGRPDDTRISAAVRRLKGERRKTLPAGEMELMDNMEQVTLAGIACLCAWMTVQGALSKWGPNLLFPDMDEIFPEFENIFILYAIPLGIICAVWGFCYLIIQGGCRAVATRIGQRIVMWGMPQWFVTLLLPTIAGLIHGTISTYYPLTLGTGTDILPQLLILGFNSTDAIGTPEIQNGDEILSPHYLLVSAMVNSLVMGICLGFGLVGGQIMPMIFTGSLLGLSIPHYLPFIPKALALPCCAMGIATSFVPTPFSFILVIVLASGIPTNYGAAMFTTTLVSYTLLAGTGVLTAIVEKKEEILQFFGLGQVKSGSDCCAETTTHDLSGSSDEDSQGRKNDHYLNISNIS
mmetsp:Transcript_45668/g.53459  ORF Transcript_45668/g.53459 Transcript_45668/m.53459 type:complete len:614 (-) Transcript_45668:126-1967(-)